MRWYQQTFITDECVAVANGFLSNGIGKGINQSRGYFLRQKRLFVNENHFSIEAKLLLTSKVAHASLSRTESNTRPVSRINCNYIVYSHRKLLSKQLSLK